MNYTNEQKNIIRNKIIRNIDRVEQILPSEVNEAFSNTAIENTIKVKIETSDICNVVENIDCFEGLKNIKSSSVSLILTDPPYFIEGMGDDWDKEKLAGKRFEKSTVASLPGGMKFDPAQGKKNEEFSRKLGVEYLRVLKPGGFLISFSQARLYHRMTLAFEDCGFEIRDMLGWTYEGQAKAFSQDHFIDKMKISDEEKIALKKSLGGRKTPQLKPMIEPMCLAQKPKEGTFIENWKNHGVGLIDVNNPWEDKFPGNIMFCKKPTKEEKGIDNKHLTVKPIKLIKHLINIFCPEGHIVLDPFLGSGTTAVAALATNRKIIGFEINKEYFKTIEKRISGI